MRESDANGSAYAGLVVVVVVVTVVVVVVLLVRRRRQYAGPSSPKRSSSRSHCRCHALMHHPSPCSHITVQRLAASRASSPIAPLLACSPHDHASSSSMSSLSPVHGTPAGALARRWRMLKVLRVAQNGQLHRDCRAERQLSSWQRARRRREPRRAPRRSARRRDGARRQVRGQLGG